nr:V-type ATP synthase subunit I [uncultured Dorea sp.]
MAVLQMQRISICALKRDRKAILEQLQSMGVMEMHQVAQDETGFEKMDTQSAKVSFEKRVQLTENALDVLNQYAPEKKSMFASLEGNELIDKADWDEVAAKQEAVMDVADLLIADHKKIAEAQAEIVKLQTQIESLAPWMSLEVPMNYPGTKKTAMFLGTIAADMTLEMVYEKIAEDNPELEAFDISVISQDRDAVYLSVFCLKEQAAEVENALRTCGFSRPAMVSEEIPAERKQKLEAQIVQIQAEIAGIKDDINAHAKDREELKIIGDYYRMRAEKYEVLGTLPQSKRTFIISGYAAKEVIPAVEKAIGEAYDCVIDVEELKEDEEPPVLLKNNGFSESVEGVLESYGLPHKGEIDPTTIMSFFYVFFFGMMLSDAAYGAIIAIVCLVVLKKFPRMSAGMRKSMKMFMYCGLSTLVWGVLFGGYFGDVVDVVSSTFFGKELTIKPLWFAPLNDPMKLLIYSMGFGLVHLFVGLGIKGYMLLKDGKVLDFFCDIVLWYIFLIGLIMMLLPSDIFASIAQTKIVFPAALVTLSKALAIIGAVGLLLMSGRSSKNPALRLALGAYDIYNITGWLSDVLSYSRLLALGLATGVIASVVNQMGSMLGKSVFGVILFIVVFIVGHTMNLAINLLGAYVHTNRLQFVEFFGKFYEGGGKPFEPFRAETKYVDIKEEK